MYITTPEQLAVAVRRARREQNMTQKRISDLVGVKQATVSAFENHPEATQIETLFKILSALELHLIVEPRDQPHNASGWTEEW